MSWRLEQASQKQIDYIVSMHITLGIDENIPKTKGECSDKITELQNAIQSHLQVFGFVKPSNRKSRVIAHEDNQYDSGYDSYLDEIW